RRSSELQTSRPPPRITSGPPPSTYWRAIRDASVRSGTLAKNAAGEASVTEVVVTRPVARPAASAARPNVGRGSPSASTPTEPLDVREPVDHAVAAAAESVTVSSGSSGGPVT